jgi:hypothetical protein
LIVFVKSIVAQFVLHIRKDEQATTHANYQANDVDGREEFILHDIANSNFVVIFKHTGSFGLRCKLQRTGCIFSERFGR